LTPFKAVSYAFLYGLQYLRTFGDATWRPYAAGGLGVKAYRYEEFNPENVSPTIAGVIGVPLPLTPTRCGYLASARPCGKAAGPQVVSP
jgi:hypothetical protein